MHSESRKEKIIETLSSCVNFGDPEKFYNELIQLKGKFYQDEEKSELFNFLEAFGNRERFLILDMLKKKDRCVCELETILQKTQPAVSHHLRILEKCNLIKSTRVGKFSHYSLVRSQFKKFQQMWKKWAEDITNWFGE
ncbi:MAG: ArsR/SmtB family transcription factor [Promethearchaeota archaeon]